MKLKLALLLTLGLTCGLIHAQEEDPAGAYFDSIDADGNGKVDLAEIRAFSAQDLPEDATDMQRLDALVPHLIDFLLGDADDDGQMTRAEFTAYFADLSEGNTSRFSVKDWESYRKHYLDPYFEALLKEADKDGDKALSKAEFASLYGEDDFDSLDSDGDGKLTAEEYRKAIKGYLAELYDFEGEEDHVSKDTRDSFDNIDTNGDGGINREEWKKALYKDGGNPAEWWGTYFVFVVADGNNDGKVDLIEYARFVRNQARGVDHKVYPADVKLVLDEIWGATDGDKDGTLSEAEWLKVFEGSDTDADELRTEFKEADADKDGKVTREELWPMLKEQFEPLGYEFLDKDPGDDVAEEPAGIDRAGYALYLKKGRTWLIRSTTNIAGMDPIVNYTKWEVLEVGEKSARCRMTMLDKDKKETHSQEIEIEFRAAEGNGDAPEVETREETVKVEAGEFECIVVTSAGTTTWTSRKFPGLLVKSETKGDLSSTSELVEFNE
jgi:Ca2+-binding EF-hand superfamily protein